VVNYRALLDWTSSNPIFGEHRIAFLRSPAAELVEQRSRKHHLIVGQHPTRLCQRRSSGHFATDGSLGTMALSWDHRTGDQTRCEGTLLGEHPNKHIREAIRLVPKDGIMKQHEFTLVLTADPDDEQADRMYGTFDDGTIATVAGVPQIHFHRAAKSLEEAIRSAIGDVRSIGFDVARIEMEPNAVAQAS
jgi:hypothetical protein